MEVAVRSYFATGVALVGAGVIAVSPVVPKPDVELPALPAVHASVPVELTALENPLELVAQLVQQSLANVNALGKISLGTIDDLVARMRKAGIRPYLLPRPRKR